MTTQFATTFELPGFDELLSRATGLLSALESAVGSRVLDEVTTDANATDHDLDTPLGELEGRLDAIDGIVIDAARIVDALDTGPIDALAGEAIDLRASTRLVSARAEETNRAIERLEQQLHHEDEATRAAHGEAAASIEEFSGEVRGQHQANTRDAFTALGETLSDRCAAAIHEGLQSLDQQVDHAFDGLHVAASQAGNGWSEASARLLADTAQHVVDTVLRELRDGIERLVREGIEAFVDELTEQLAMVTAGAATTSALAPLVPAMIAAKRVLQVINRLLSFLGC
jgi:DNA anti-recombination protein RmuC